MNDGHQHDDNYSVSPAAMSDEQIARRDAMTMTPADHAAEIAWSCASMGARLEELCKSVERLERERDEMRTLITEIVEQWGKSAEYGQIPYPMIERAEKLLAGG